MERKEGRKLKSKKEGGGDARPWSLVVILKEGQGHSWSGTASGSWERNGQTVDRGLKIEGLERDDTGRQRDLPCS